MITKDFFNEYYEELDYEKYRGIINIIDEKQIDTFVNYLFCGYLIKRGSLVEQEFLSDINGETETNIFITHIIEVGGLLIIAENKLPMINVHIIFIVSLYLNISIGNALKTLEWIGEELPFYFVQESAKIIEGRIVGHLSNAPFQNNYVTNLVDDCLFGKISSDYRKEILKLLKIK